MSLEPRTISYKKYVNPPGEPSPEVYEHIYGNWEPEFTGKGTFLGWTSVQKDDNAHLPKFIGSHAIVAIEDGTIRIMTSFRIKFDCFVIPK